jgi:hypothetical protein
LAAPAHPLGDERAFVLGHRPANLEQQLIVRVVTHGAVQKLYLTAMLFQLLQQHHLVHVVARQTIRRSDQHQV